MKKPETTLEEKVCDYAEKTYGMLAWKFTSPGLRGVPDRIFVNREGLVVFIEFKKPGEMPDAQQARRIEELIERGAYVCGIWDYDEGKALIDVMANTAQFVHMVATMAAERAAEARREAAASELILPPSVSTPRY